MTKAKTQATQAASTDTSSSEPESNIDSGATEAQSGSGQTAVPESPPDEAGDMSPAPRFVAARVLVHCHLGEPNDVVEIDEELAATMTDIIDATPEAVAYARSLAED